MPRRKKMPKHRLINFSANQYPQIMPWFKAQYNQKLSVYLLIRMAQRVGGNKDWPSVMQNLTSDLVVHDSLMDKRTGRPSYRFQSHNQPARPYYTERRKFLKQQSAQINQKSSPIKTKQSNIPSAPAHMPQQSQPQPNPDFHTVASDNLKSDDNTVNNQVSNKDLKNLGINKKW